MREKTRSSSSVSMGVLGWLFIIFVWLKLNPGGNFTTPIADWSWWLVTAPIWIPLLAALAVLAFVGIFYAISNRS